MPIKKNLSSREESRSFWIPASAGMTIRKTAGIKLLNLTKDTNRRFKTYCNALDQKRNAVSTDISAKEIRSATFLRMKVTTKEVAVALIFFQIVF